MRVRATEPFGAEVSDVRLDTASDGVVAALREETSFRRVLVVREQELGPRTFADFLSRLGESMFTEGETPVADEPRLNLVTNRNRTRPPRSVFHTDTSYVERPPAFTALCAVDVPMRGGETLFSDQVRAARTLPDAARERLAGRTLRHTYTAPGRAEAAAWHPALRRHPLTGETALYLSTPERCARVSGADARTSRRAIQLLYAHSIRARRILRHRWREGDVVIWDDRLTLHKADHSAVHGARAFYRGMVRGERPLMAGAPVVPLRQKVPA